jgi:hypothetical protein
MKYLTELPHAYLKLAYKRYAEQNGPTDYLENLVVNDINWSCTPEGEDFWDRVNDGRLPKIPGNIDTYTKSNNTIILMLA